MRSNDVSRMSGRWVRRGREIILLPDADGLLGEMEEETGPIPATQQGVIHPAIDVHAQYALMRMSRGDPSARADAWGMLGAVKAGRLGIYKVDQQKPALRAKKLGSSWWTVIPAGEDAAVLMEPGGTEPPFIVFRDGVKGDAARLDPALRRAWSTFGMLGRCGPAPGRGGMMAEVLPGRVVPANLVPPMLCAGPPPKGPRGMPPCPIQDRTGLTDRGKRKSLKRTDFKALVLHQMGFSRGDNPARYDDVTAHYAITPNGTILQLHPDAAYLFASNRFNRFSVAVEFAGNFPNRKGSCWKPQKHGCHTVTPRQISAGRCLVRHLVAKLGITQVLAHRQSSAMRENDPGPDLWLNVGQWAVDNLGLSDGGPGYKIDDGKPIPPDWRK
ncbi:peptidoglycan recognition family protein [Longimicrobium sp.]|uniref:peptidoglycan recognition protein family protein n=1 Tax=Longimicrobium sp. TaxID=2029185 RepID=UPI002E2F65ED|nr:peptidoglycan recognition family protein [Longimicrobium sp.]HEX6041289.1 peptidoglycan recognition family protein [Longimicrobium sp.]